MYARGIEEKDREMLQKAIDADVYHAKEKGFTPGIFFEPGTKTVVYGDDSGDVLAVNVRNVALATVQFLSDDRARVRKTMEEGLPGFARMLGNSGARGILYESLHLPLILFLRKFGFKRIRHFFMKEIGA
jgi:hypothetical protein